VLGGLWHGANWTFVIWGAIHGLGLAAERYFRAVFVEPKTRMSEPLLVWLRRILIFNLVGIAWIFFRANNLSEALAFLAGIASWNWRPEYWVAFKFLGFFALLLFLFDLRIERHREEYAFQSKAIGKRFGFAIALLVMIFLLGANHSNAFIYFQF